MADVVIGVLVRIGRPAPPGPETIAVPSLLRRAPTSTMPERPVSAAADGIACRGSDIGRGVVATQVRFLHPARRAGSAV